MVITIPSQKKDDRLEKKRLAEKQRRARIRSNEALQDVLKTKLRDKYLKKKAEGKVLSIQEMASWQKQKVRERNREYSRNYRIRQRARRNIEEILICSANNQTTGNNRLYSAPPKPTQKVDKAISVIYHPYQDRVLGLVGAVTRPIRFFPLRFTNTDNQITTF